jgi:hypothetical protein
MQSDCLTSFVVSVVADAQFALNLSVLSLELLNLVLHLGAGFLLDFKCLFKVSNVGLGQLRCWFYPKKRNVNF